LDTSFILPLPISFSAVIHCQLLVTLSSDIPDPYANGITNSITEEFKHNETPVGKYDGSHDENEVERHRLNVGHRGRD
jgi:hypothetical protein